MATIPLAGVSPDAMHVRDTHGNSRFLSTTSPGMETLVRNLGERRVSVTLPG